MPRGQVVGGSSVTNGAVALRGHPEHYDQWERFVDGYGWETWLPWFRRIERDLDFGAEPWHGDAGPIPVSRYPRAGWLALQERFCEAALARGHGWVDDHNRPGALGVGPIPLNMIDGRRQTPADHYLDPALARPALRLETGVVVDRVRLAAGRAVAVEGIDGAGRPARWEADAVVLALGSYATPAALLRSGVGPAAELRRHGIAVLHELPGVGLGMQDHPKISYRFDLEIPAPSWPNLWYQALLTGAVAVRVRARRGERPVPSGRS